ncbi:MAG TPA: hypothetical protein VFI69_11960 [Candidatus Limnocylindrales bacterium]|jgi:hypothetical protein|nr:hypothetical protein [Candidatus Limnocylindrales bacterium]
MQVISPAASRPRPSIGPLLGGVVVGTLLVVGGVVLAVLAFATPILGAVVPSGRPSVGEMATGVVIWALALVAPAAFLLAGASRLMRTLAVVRGRMPRRSTTLKALETLPADLTVAHGLALPDGRPVSELVLGAFGAAVIRELPPAGLTRIRDGRWEVRGQRGWIALENPLERASRDAERVRRWLAHDDADFVVKVYAAVVGPQPTVARTATCAVLSPDQLGAWITALPAQRSITDGRREQMLETVREAAR